MLLPFLSIYIRVYKNSLYNRNKIDKETLKLQEAPELIPTGEMPRTFLVTVDRDLTDKVTPGNRVKLVGILGIIQ